MTLYTWNINDSEEPLTATCDELPLVGLRADTLAGLNENIRRYEQPFVQAIESERSATKGRRYEEGSFAPVVDERPAQEAVTVG